MIGYCNIFNLNKEGVDILFDLPVMLVIVLFLALGIFSQWLANRIKWPSIVVMSIVGLLVGPILGLANP